MDVSSDLLLLSMQLNRQAFARPVIDGWLNSFLALLCERFASVRGVQVVQVIGKVGVVQGSSGIVPAGIDDEIPLDNASPLAEALRTHQRSRAPDLRVYPLLYGEEILGGLIIYAVDLPTELDDALSTLALQLGAALVQQPRAAGPQTGPLRRELDMMRSLYELTRDVIAGLSSSDAFSLATRSLVETLKVDHATVLLYDEPSGTGEIVAEYPSRGSQGLHLPLRGSPLMERARRNPQPIILSDLNNVAAELEAGLAPAKGLGVRSMLIVPMMAQNIPIGSIGIDAFDAPREFSPEEIEGVQVIAKQLAASVRNAQLFDELQRRASQFERLAALSRRVMASLERNTILRIVAEETRQLIHAAGVSVAIHWPDEPTLYLYLIGEGTATPIIIELPYSETALRFVCNTGESLTLDDISGSEYPDYKILARHAPPDSWETEPIMHGALIAPLLVGGRAIGTFNLTDHPVGTYTSLDLAMLEQIANQLAIALENARLFAQAAARVQTERLANRLSASLQQGDLQGMILNTTQEIADALGARRARVRLNIDSAESVDSAKLKKLLESRSFGGKPSKPEGEVK